MGKEPRMMTKFPVTVAAVAIAASAAFAQSQPAPATNAPAMQTPQSTGPAVTKVSNATLASKLIGHPTSRQDSATAEIF